MTPRRAASEIRLAGGIAALLVVVFGLLFWPPLTAPLDLSIDSAWRWGLSVIAHRGLEPALLPYGPLGLWLEPRAVAGGGLAGAALARSLAIAGILAGLAAWAARRGSPGTWIVAGGITGATLLVTGRWPDHGLVAGLLALLAPAFDEALEGATEARWRPLGVGVLVGVGPFLKLPVALGALGIAAGTCAAFALGWTRWNARSLAWAGAGVVAGSGFGAAISPGSLVGLIGWLSGAAEIASVYPNAMALEGSVLSALALAGPLAVAATFAAFDLGTRSPIRGFWLAAALPLLLALRHGAVRPDVHALAVAAVATPVLVLAALLSSRPSRRWAGLAAAGLALATAAPHAASVGLLSGASAVAEVRRWGTLEGVRSTLAPGATQRAVVAAGLARLRGGEIDPDLASHLDDARGVDVVPWRVQVLESLGLSARWRPSPTVLLPLAASRELDRRAARHFASDGAPGRLLIHADRLEGRPLLWESPLAWRAIRARYRVIERGGGWRLARRAAMPRREVRRLLGESVLRWGRWTPIPVVDPGESVRAAIELRPTPLGRLRRALYRAEPVWLDLPGRPIRRFRLLPELASAGLELAPPGATLAELDAWLEGRSLPRADRVRLRSRDARRYRPVRVRWWAVRLGDAELSGLVPERLDRPLGEGAEAGREARAGGE